MKTCIACGCEVRWEVVQEELGWVLYQADQNVMDSLTEAMQSVLNGRVCSANCLSKVEDPNFNGAVNSSDEYVDLIEHLFHVCDTCSDERLCTLYRCHQLNKMLDCQYQKGWSNMYDYIITADGGCLGNGTENAHGYGSYLIETRDKKQRIYREDYEDGFTNNQAEYSALIGALSTITNIVLQNSKILKDYSILIKMDSALVIGQSQLKWKCKSLGLRPLLDRVRELMSEFKSVEFKKITGDEMKQILGH